MRIWMLHVLKIAKSHMPGKKCHTKSSSKLIELQSADFFWHRSKLDKWLLLITVQTDMPLKAAA